MSFDQDPNEQANISAADFAIMCDEMKALRAELAEANARIIMEFSEDEHPEFSQGLQHHEILSIVTAEQCNGMVRTILKLRAALTDMCAEFRAADLPYGSKAYSRAINLLNPAEPHPGKCTPWRGAGGELGKCVYCGKVPDTANAQVGQSQNQHE